MMEDSWSKPNAQTKTVKGEVEEWDAQRSCEKFCPAPSNLDGHLRTPLSNSQSQRENPESSRRSKSSHTRDPHPDHQPPPHQRPQWPERKKCQSSNTYLAKLSLKNGVIKTFPDKENSGLLLVNLPYKKCCKFFSWDKRALDVTWNTDHQYR